MENVDFQKEGFSWKKMMPNENDWLTTQWIRRLSMNYINGYGLIGTLILDAGEYTTINLGLTKKFIFPPMISIYYSALSAPSNGLTSMWSWRQSRYSDAPIQECPGYYLKDDALIVIGGRTFNSTIYFRIHGV